MKGFRRPGAEGGDDSKSIRTIHIIKLQYSAMDERQICNQLLL